MVFDNMTLFQAGSISVGIVSSVLCLSNKNEIERVEREYIKNQIVKILDNRGNVNISTLAEEMSLPPRKVVSALKELEEEGLIREGD